MGNNPVPYCKKQSDHFQPGPHAAVSVPGAFGEVVDVTSFHHLGEIDRHTVKDFSRFSVRFHLFVAKGSNRRRAINKLCEKEDQ